MRTNLVIHEAHADSGFQDNPLYCLHDGRRPLGGGPGDAARRSGPACGARAFFNWTRFWSRTIPDHRRRRRAARRDRQYRLPRARTHSRALPGGGGWHSGAGTGHHWWFDVLDVGAHRPAMAIASSCLERRCRRAGAVLRRHVVSMAAAVASFEGTPAQMAASLRGCRAAGSTVLLRTQIPCPPAVCARGGARQRGLQRRVSALRCARTASPRCPPVGPRASINPSAPGNQVAEVAARRQPVTPPMRWAVPAAIRQWKNDPMKLFSAGRPGQPLLPAGCATTSPRPRRQPPRLAAGAGHHASALTRPFEGQAPAAPAVIPSGPLSALTPAGTKVTHGGAAVPGRICGLASAAAMRRRICRTTRPPA